MSKIVPIKPFLIVFYGYPGSGRTYFARQFCDEIQAAHLQSDKIRAQLFETPRYDTQENAITKQLMDYMAEEFLSVGVSIVYDADIHTNAQRLALKNLALKFGAELLVIWLQVDVETSFLRNVKRDKRKIDDKFATKWDRSTFDRVTKKMQNPTPSKELIVISGKHLFQTQRNAVLSALKNRSIINKSDNLTKVAKPGMVNLVPINQGRVDMSRRNIFIR